MSLQNQLIDTMADITGIDANHITMGTTMDELGLDSLDSVGLTLDLEDQFRIDLDEKEVNQCATLGEIYNLINKQ